MARIAMARSLLLSLWLCAAYTACSTAQNHQYNYQQYSPTPYPVPYGPTQQPNTNRMYYDQHYPQYTQYTQYSQPLPQPLHAMARAAGGGGGAPPPSSAAAADPAAAAPSPAQTATAAVYSPEPPMDEKWAQQVDATISRGVVQLSLRLARVVEAEGLGQVSNVVFSPVNVAAALALVLAGSNGTTFDEIAGLLGIPNDPSVLAARKLVHKEFGRFLGELESQPTDAANATPGQGGNHVVFANGLFVQQEFNIQPDFADIAQSYKSEVIHVEFARKPTLTRDIINSWFAEHTMGRIRSVLAEAPPTDSKLMIASALYFNGEWESPFPVEATMTRPFYAVSTNGKDTEAFPVRMMTNNMELPFAANRTLGCRLLELPYKGRDVSMFLILPDADGLEKLRQLERNLDPDTLEQLLASRKDAPVIYTVPRMKLQRSVSLRTALEALGVHTLFDEKLADLTHLSNSVVERVPLAPSHAHAPTATPRPSAQTAPQPTPPRRSTTRPLLPSAVENTITDALFFADRMGNGSTYAAQQAQPVPPAPQGPPAAQAPPHATQAQPAEQNQQALGDRWSGPQFYPARLYADDVLHKVEVEVTETGTVASAATAITISRDGSNHVVRFNRPFLFFIRHKKTGLMLFYGTVVRPMPEWIVPGVNVSQLGPPRPLGSNRNPPPASSQPQGRRPQSSQRQSAGPGATTPRPTNG